MNRNAVIMAAGMSTRFVPLSIETPKALLKVKGEVLIERQISQLREAGIQEIVVVVGYLKEKFEYLQEKYGVILIENPDYKTKNNHSTLYAARKYLKNTFICSGDNYFAENVFLSPSIHPYYASVFSKGDTDEWCMKTDDSEKIIKVQIGGRDSWIMKGQAYFTEEFSKTMVPYLEKTYASEDGKDKFWEDIFIEHIDEMDMYIRKYDHGVIEEFDSIEELRMFDGDYIEQSGSKIMKKVSESLDCSESEIYNISPVKERGAAVGFSFRCKDCVYSYFFDTGSLMQEKEMR